jgi:hypothetical protein
MPAKSKSQQRLFGMVTAYKDGKLKLDDLPKSLAKKIKSIADGSKKKTGDKRKKTKGITKKAAKDIASTKHKKLPERVTERFNQTHIIKVSTLLNEGKTINQSPKEIADEVYAIIINARVGDKPIKEKWLKDTLKGFGYDEDSDNGKLFDDVASELVDMGLDFELDEDKNQEDTKIEVKSMADFGDEVANLDVDALKGGEAQGMTIEDVADMHNVPIEYIEKIMPLAIEIELEHTDDAEVAARIALDHLSETPLYYDEKIGLPEMEEELEEMEDAEIEEVIDDRMGKNENLSIKKLSEFSVNENKDESLTVLSDFVDEPGETEIWYEKTGNYDAWDFREDMYKKEKEKGDDYYTKRYGERINPKDLEKTHVLLGKIKETDPNKIFHMMNTWGQGEVTNKFLLDKGATHTSMSVGDIIKIDDKVLFVDGYGFKDITDE